SSFRLAVIEPPARTFSSPAVAAAIGGMAIARLNAAATKDLSIVASRLSHWTREYPVMAGLAPTLYLVAGRGVRSWLPLPLFGGTRIRNEDHVRSGETRSPS